MSSVVFVALGGACGALARYGAGRLVDHFVASPFPLGTWAVNLVGCALIGMVVPLLNHLGAAERAHLFLVAGFLGSFTTFSTYSLDTVVLWGDGAGLLSLLNAVGSLVCGLLLVVAGRELSAWMLGV